MRVSRDRLADDDDGVRASDAERDQAIGQLKDRFADGMLSQDTFLYRMDAALHAKDRSDLVELFTDLPVPIHRPSLRQRIVGRLTGGRRAPVHAELTGRYDPGWQLAGGQVPGGQAAGGPVVSRQPALPPLWLPREDRRFTIGRAMACDFTLADLSVSRWHARLYRKDDDWLLSDLGSTNGTRLNGWRVTTGVPVKPGDQVTFGSISFVISDKDMSVGQAGAVG